MPTRTLDLRFPALGVVRRTSLRSTPEGRGPYPTPWSLNVRLEDSIAERLRGGSFAGISATARPSEILYRDRVLTIHDSAIRATRMGDHSDTSFASDVSDTLRAKLFQLSLMGETGENVVALVPHKDRFLLCFTAGETWVQQGDPYEGPLSRVSDQVGIVGADAWCVAHDTVYFLSSHGLYSVGADGSNLRAISEDRIPEDLSGVSDSACTLTYQHSDQGVYIHKTGQDWFYDTERGGFWPFDTSEADSHLLIGPLRLGTPDWIGQVQTLHGIIADGSSTVYWRIVHGKTAEEAASNGKLAIEADLAGSSYSSYIRGSGSWAAGRSQTAMPRTSAMWACLWLSSAGAWSYEGATMGIVSTGRWRK